ncbi:MerC domain-containing protein [Maribacter flavus]|uniref:MerC domain-containing protein n=1 Tax=Maribacter flavus TaxID=1658664 RepID=A0A5B2TYD6_9FLAO|nr:MerC domain-containing protein [Maribacter flavus]KAA2218680.1 MerC domain-containing protein [Maribacter flavus]
MKQKYYDLIGIYSATLCLMHCLLAPFLLVLPIGRFHHPLIDGIFLTIGILPVVKIIKNKVPVFLKILVLCSFLLIALAIFIEAVYHIESSLIYFGATGLIISHFINYKYHRH